MSKEKLKEFNEFVKEQLTECGIVNGMTVAIFDSKEILYKCEYGYANATTGRKMKFTDKFCIGSCSKSVLCLAISLAIEKGDIENIWEMRLSEFYEVHSDLKDIPVKLLACHQSGIDDFRDCSKKIKDLREEWKDLDGIDKRSALATVILKRKPLSPPGTEYSYSSRGYGILGSIIEKITGKDYTELIKTYVTNPLDIHADFSKYFMGEGYAEGHKYDSSMANEKPVPLGEHESVNHLEDTPAGHIWINILDSSKYLQSYLKAFNEEDDALFSKKIHLKQTTPINIKVKDASFGWGQNIKDNIIGHGGKNFQTATNYHIIPKNNIGFAICTNTYHGGSTTIHIAKKFRDLFR
jgi:CubicO group peptidase (beta-lactamase class C family)